MLGSLMSKGDWVVQDRSINCQPLLVRSAYEGSTDESSGRCRDPSHPSQALALRNLCLQCRALESLGRLATLMRTATGVRLMKRKKSSFLAWVQVSLVSVLLMSASQNLPFHLYH